MGDMLRDGASWLAEVQRSHVAGTVRYERPGTLLVVAAMHATVGRSEFEQWTEGGMLVRVETTDWIVATGDMTFDDGTPLTPERGDLVIDTSHTGYSITYEVRGPSLNEPPWRWADLHRRQARIHSTLRRNTAT